MPCRIVIQGPIYFDSVRQAARLVREMLGCKRKTSYTSGSTLVNVCRDGRRLFIRFRTVIVGRAMESYVVLDWVIECRSEGVATA